MAESLGCSDLARTLSSLARRAVRLLALTALGCAHIQNEHVATPIDEHGDLLEQERTKSGLVISGQEVTAYSSTHFGMVEVTFENKSPDWVRIPRLSLEFGNAAMDAEVLLPTGGDITAWYLATVQRNQISDTNEASALVGLFVLGQTAELIGAATEKRGLAAVGKGLALAAGTAAVADGISDGIQRAERVSVLPHTHLLALPLAVPPGLFAKKWVLVNTRDRSTPCVLGLILDYDVESHGHERVLLKFRRAGHRSEWQREACMAGSIYRRPRRPKT